MKKYIGFLSLWALLAACSTSRVASTDDNVYVSKTRAKEYQPYVRREQVEPSRVEEVYQEPASTAYQDDYYDLDVSYSSRLDRFNNYAPWRNYYDSWYDYRYDPYYSSVSFYDRYYFRSNPLWSWNVYLGSSYPWHYNPYRYRWGNYWGIYSYYNPMPYYPRYNYGGRFSDDRYPYNPRTYRARPTRDGNNSRPGGGTGTNQGGRADRYNGGSPTNPPARTGGSINAPRPDRSSGGSRPTTNSQPSRPERVERPSAPARSERSDSGSTKDTNTDNRPRPSRGDK